MDADQDLQKDQETESNYICSNIKRESDYQENEADSITYACEKQTMIKFETCYVKEYKCNDDEEGLSSGYFKTEAEDLGCAFIEDDNNKEVDNTEIENIHNRSLILRGLLESDTSGTSGNLTKSSTVDNPKSLALSEFQHKHNKKNSEENSILKNYECEVCNRKFSSTYHLKQHVNSVHKGVKNYECSICSKKFSYSYSLKEHTNAVHKRIKDYECNECHKKFYKLQDLKVHINMVHIKIRDYECQLCHKTFSKLQTLKQHASSIHTKIKNYECEICHKKFTQLASLRRHSDSVHKGIKDFVCHVCDRKFCKLHDLKTHVNSVHLKIKDHKCEKCGKEFYLVSKLKRHINTVHSSF